MAVMCPERRLFNVVYMHPYLMVTRARIEFSEEASAFQLIEQLQADAAVQAADTLMLTIPSQAGVDLNLHILESFAQHVAPALGWKPNTEGPVQGDPVS